MPIRTIVNYLEPYGVQVNRFLIMRDIFSDFFNALNLNYKASMVIQMPYGSVVKLIADECDYDYMWISENVNENDKTLLETTYVSECERFIKRNVICAFRSSMSGYLSDLYGYVYRTLLEGKDAFGDADFVDRNKCYHFCDEEKVLKGEELVYAFDLLLFSNREFCGVQKAYVVIDVDCCGGNIKVTDGSNMYEEYVPYSDVPDEDFHYYVCETFGSLLKQVVVDIAKDIIESDLIV